MDALGQRAGLSVSVGILASGALLLIPFAIMMQPIIKRCLDAGSAATWLAAIPIAIYGGVAISAFVYGLVMFTDAYQATQQVQSPYGDTTEQLP